MLKWDVSLYYLYTIKKRVQFVLFETMTVKITKTPLKQILVCSVFFGSILCFGGMFSFPCRACFLSAKMERDSKKIFQQSHGKHLVLASLKYSSVHNKWPFIQTESHSLFSPLSCCGPLTETVRLSDPRMHQALHRPQLVTKARQSSFSQRPSGQGGQGTSNKYIFLHGGHFILNMITFLINNHRNKHL